MTRSSDRASPVRSTEPAITLRALESQGDYRACVQLQRDTWGAAYGDIVPASVLKVSQLTGGVSGGAFTAAGRLVGFVYGLTGPRDGRLIHWSHMLAVAPDYRNHGVGRRLKEYQRDVLRSLGIEMIYWTFDPLVARNAHLNLNRLGTAVQEYVPDMYGDTGSELHAFGTDRFVVSWAVAPGEQSRNGDAAGMMRRLSPGAWRSAPVANGADMKGNRSGRGGAELLRIEIPADVETMAVKEAQAWREATRPAFVRLLRDGFRVTGFVKDAEGCFYLLSRTDAGAERE
jgi:predicted GNAT superfamily acetyltransferase